LFRDFADVSRTQGGVLLFANAHGLLGRPAPPAAGGQEKEPAGEHMSIWQREITALRQVVDLWARHQAGDERALARHILWAKEAGGKDVVTYRSRPFGDDQELSTGELKSLLHPDEHDADRGHDFTALSCTEIIASKDIHPEWLERFRPGDVFLPALVLVQRRLNERLPELLSPRLLYDLRDGRMSLSLAPSSLLGALWLEFGQAVTANKKFRQCLLCRRWFEVRPPVTRSTRIFCGNGCRLRVQRLRSKIREMLETGMLPEQIVHALGIDLDTFERVLSSKAGE
jgi:hypothetical protein